MTGTSLKPMTTAEIEEEIRRGNTYPGKVWYCTDSAKAFEDRVARAKALGYPRAACLACANLSTPASAICAKCIAETPWPTNADIQAPAGQ